MPRAHLAPLLAVSSLAALLFLRARKRQTSRRALALLKTVETQVLEEELDRRRVGSHVFNTTVRPLHPLRAKLLDAELLKLGISAADDLAPGPPRKAYDSFARPRDGEPCDDAYVAKKAPLIAQQVAFLHRHELARRNELLRNVDDAERALANARRPRHNVTLVLDNLRSAENVGSIFRTADATRASIVTCGFTTTPPDRKLQKTALGAITSVPCTHYEGTLQAVRALRERGLYVVALETTEDAVPLGVAPQLGDEARGVAVVLGNEVTGVDKTVLDECGPTAALAPYLARTSPCPRPVPRPEPPLTRRPRARCDAVLEIPVFGVKNSLNVACCASIVLYEARTLADARHTLAAPRARCRLSVLVRPSQVLRRWAKFEAAPQASNGSAQS